MSRLGELAVKMNMIERDELLGMIDGRGKADIAIKNGYLVNVSTGEIHPENIAVKGGYIAALGDIDPLIGGGTVVIDVKGEYIMPGFIETHMHISGSHLSMQELARILLRHGTTTISTDLAHIGIVAGLKGIRAFVQEAKRTALRVLFVLPTVSYFQNVELGFARTPDAPSLQDLHTMLKWKECVGVGETLIEVLRRDKGLASLFAEATRMGKVVTGTTTGIRNNGDLNEYILYGASSDHEMKTAEYASRLARYGMYVHVREGSAASDLKSVIQAITRGKCDPRRFLYCTDEEDPYRLERYGNIDYKINMSIEAGLDPVKAIQIATINAAEYFKLADSFGSVSPGKAADVVISGSIDRISVDKVIAGGKLVVDGGRYIGEEKKSVHPHFLRKSIRLGEPLEPKDFDIRSSEERQKVQIIDIEEGSLISSPSTDYLPVERGIIRTDVERDILKIAMVDRYAAAKKIGNAFIRGFGLKRGAIASSFSPMTENILVVGVESESMSFAVNSLCKLGGGLIAADGDDILGLLELPVLGLISEEELETVVSKLQKLLDAIKDMGCGLRSPFTTLGFMGITRLGRVKLSPAGLFQTEEKRFLPSTIE